MVWRRRKVDDKVSSVKPALLLLFIAAALATGPAWAQVVVNQAALDQLAGIEPAPLVSVPVAPVRPIMRRHAVRRLAAKPAAAQRLALATVPPPLPQLTLGPPDLPAAHGAKPAPTPDMTPPPAIKPAPAVAPAPIPAVARPAVTATPAAPLPRADIRFAGGSAALPASAKAALAALCRQPGMVVVDALAPADASDPSAAMRLSMSRAFAVRDALAACGVPATHILPRALGPIAGHDPDVTLVRVSPGSGG